MKSKAKTRRPEWGSYVPVTNTEGIWGSELNVDNHQILHSCWRVHSCQSCLQYGYTKKSFSKYIKTQGMKTHELIIIFPPHACFPKTGNRKDDGGHILVVPGAQTGAIAWSNEENICHEIGYHSTCYTHPSPCTEWGLNLSTWINFFPNYMKFSFSFFY